MTNSRLIKLEKLFFYLVVVINIIPAIWYKFFPTLDGVAHLYNSNLINQLLFSHNEQLRNFFSFNNEAVPNWTGHIILSVFNLFLPAYLAEKILLLFYLIGLPFAFRKLVKIISPDNYLFSYLIFPFTYSFPFFLGFYNFCLGLVFLLITLNYWLKNENNLGKTKIKIILFLLFIITYFTHVFVFGLLMIIIALQIIIKTIYDILETRSSGKIFSDSVKKSVIVFCLAFIPICLMLFYFLSRSSNNVNTYVPGTALMEWIKNMRSLISYNIQDEEAYTKKIFYIICSISVIGIYLKINSVIKSKEIKGNSFVYFLKNLIKPADFLLLTAVFFFVLYLKLPDSDNEAGFVSMRMNLLIFIFLCAWLATQKYSKWFLLITLSVLAYCHINRLIYYKAEIYKLSQVAVNINKISEKIEPNSIVLPLNYSDNWLHSHFSNYLGIDKPMVILENYEPTVDYFPISWNEETVPDNMLACLDSKPDLWLQMIKGDTTTFKKKIDYVFVLGKLSEKTDSISKSISQALNEYSTCVYNEDFYKLYSINK